MLQATGGQVIAVVFTSLFTMLGIVSYYFYERKIKKARQKNKIQKLSKTMADPKIETPADKKIIKKNRKKSQPIFHYPHILTTEEAAYLLKISRPHLVQLVEEGKIPCRKIGTSRRVKLQDILNFKQKTAKNWSKIHELDLLFSYVFLKSSSQ